MDDDDSHDGGSDGGSDSGDGGSGSDGDSDDSEDVGDKDDEEDSKTNPAKPTFNSTLHGAPPPESAFESVDSIARPTPTIRSDHPDFGTCTPLTTTEWAAVLNAVVAANQRTASQGSISAQEPRNVWIMKPAGKSRGRGISCSSDIGQILDKRGGHSKVLSRCAVKGSGRVH